MGKETFIQSELCDKKHFLYASAGGQVNSERRREREKKMDGVNPNSCLEQSDKKKL